MSDVREQFGKSARQYLTSPVHGDEQELRELVEWVNPSGGPILDVATGAGHTAFAFAKVASNVVALDITPEMLAVVSEECHKRGLNNIGICLASADQIPFDKNSFEGVTCRTAPHHFPDVSAFLHECARVTKSGGWLMIQDTCGIDIDDLADNELHEIEVLRDPSHVRNLKPSVWHQKITECGYVIRDWKLGSKSIGAELWFDRMRVSPENREILRAKIEGSERVLREVLNPRQKEDGLYFDLPFIAYVADKP